MKQEQEFKLQAYLDGELPETDARQVADWVAKDAEAAALLSELRQTNASLAGFERELKLPESREFYWSKIRRQIERLEAPAPAAIAEAGPAALAWLRRLLVPLAGVAVVALVCLISLRGSGNVSPTLHLETAASDAHAFVYHDYSAGATLVWLTYPADEEVADGNELGTLD